jgi:hypothetical protein
VESRVVVWCCLWHGRWHGRCWWIDGAGFGTARAVLVLDDMGVGGQAIPHSLGLLSSVVKHYCTSCR